MSYTVNELNPKQPVLIIDDFEIELSLLTLRLESELIETYGGLIEVNEALTKNPEIIMEVIWILVLNRDAFGNSFKTFYNFCSSSKEPTVDWSRRMSTCLHESIMKSMPLIKNQKRKKEIDQIKGATTDNTPCYAKYYDTMAKRYGYTISEFYDLTLRHLHILLSTIGDESYKELEVQAGLQGRKLKPRMEFKDISEEQEEEQDNHALSRLAELKAEYEAKQKGK